MVFEQQHVFGFHVAVDDALTVCVVEGPRELSLRAPTYVAEGADSRGPPGSKNGDSVDSGGA